MQESESIEKYFTKVTAIVNLMSSNGEILEDARIVEKVLRSLPPKFDYVVATIEESNDISALSIEDLQGKLEAHEIKINLRNPPPTQSDPALKTQVTTTGGNPNQATGSSQSYGRGRGRGRGGRGGRGRGRNSNFQSGRGSSNNSSDGEKNSSSSSSYRGRENGFQRGRGCGYFKCYYCDKPGHIMRECRFKQEDEKQYGCIKDVSRVSRVCVVVEYLKYQSY
ncbi:unnamed protein product [Prunus armeniaca]